MTPDGTWRRRGDDSDPLAPRSPYCQAPDFYEDAEAGVEFQVVRCVRNADHLPGLHYGVAYDRDGNMVKHFWQ